MTRTVSQATIKQRKLLLIGITLGIVFAASAMILRWTRSAGQAGGIETTQRPVYSQLNILKDEKVLAVINHQDNKLTYSTTDPELEAQLQVYLKIWEREQLEYPIGGRLANGTLWDGSATTDVTKSDFLLAIWMMLEEKLGPDYSFDVAP